MKHLEKQKKGKLRLKKLAGNIDVPQSAFFEVLSSRPRGFSTCARASGALYSDSRRYGSVAGSTDIAQLLRPDISKAEGEVEEEPATLSAQVSTPAPILPPTLHPRTRSTLLSNMLRLADSPTATAASIYSAWTELYLASPSSHAFSPVELVAVLRALHKTHQRERTIMPIAKERFQFVEAELKEIKSKAPETAGMGDGEEEWKRNDLELLADYSRLGQRRQRIKKYKLDNEERYVLRRFPAPPVRKQYDRGAIYPQALRGERREYALLANGLMYLAAKAQEEATFERWWANRIAAEYRPDNFAVLARITMMARLGRVEEMKTAWNEVAAETSRHLRERQTTPPQAEDQHVNWATPLPLQKVTGSVLINALLWHLAKQGEWADVVGAYDQLRRRLHESAAYSDAEIAVTADKASFEPSAIMGLSGNNAIHVPANIAATSETFSLLVRALSYQGDLTGALDVMRHMFAAGHVPGVPEYCSLFEGFARWGQLGRVDMDDDRGRRWKGDLDAWLPVPQVYSGTPHKQLYGRQGLTAIWSRSQIEDGATSRRSPVGDYTAGMWTGETLEALFESFLTIQPAPIRPKAESSSRRISPIHPTSMAPSPDQIWFTLLAFNRTSGGDAQTVGDAYLRLQAKFGQSNQSQGGDTAGDWQGWRVDGRLKRTLQALQSLE
jgi:pentatricopeptide repeat protein